ncbi:MAG: hypothetical protein QOG72_1717 [Sphingomonadales bacterium]|jgi:hypothetical protein|nr:hypothetical protein [Sphingomonadales bacterium]
MATKEISDHKPIPLKKKLLGEDLDVPATGASFAKARWVWSG